MRRTGLTYDMLSRNLTALRDPGRLAVRVLDPVAAVSEKPAKVYRELALQLAIAYGNERTLPPLPVKLRVTQPRH